MLFHLDNPLLHENVEYTNIAYKNSWIIMNHYSLIGVFIFQFDWIAVNVNNCLLVNYLHIYATVHITDSK